MKKIWFWAIPMFVFVCLAFVGGCKPTVIRFDSESTINLVINSLNDETAIAKLVSNVNLDDITLTYNKSVISYNQETGVIKAEGPGETVLKAKCGDAEASIVVNVEKNNFCGAGFNISSNKSYTIRSFAEGAGVYPFDLLTALKNDYPTLKKYNMGYNFKVCPIEGENVITVDEETGVVTPLKEGMEDIEITAISGISGGSFQTTKQMIRINVKKPCTSLVLSICEVDNSNNLSEVAYDYDENTQIKTYNLDRNKWYVARYQANAELTGEGNRFTLNNYFKNFENVSIDENACIAGVSITDTNYSSLMNSSGDSASESRSQFYPLANFTWQKEFIDSARNCGQSIKSNTIRVLVSPIGSIDETSMPQAYMVNSASAPIFIKGESDFSFDVSLSGGNLNNLEVSCSPSGCCSYNEDFKLTGQITFTFNNDFLGQECSVSIKDGENDVFSYGFVVWNNWNGNFLTTDQSSYELNIEDGFVRIELTEQNDTDLQYKALVIDGNIEVDLFDVDIRYDVPSIGKITATLNLLDGVNYNTEYILKFVAIDSDGQVIEQSDRLCSGDINLQITGLAQGGNNG